MKTFTLMIFTFLAILFFNCSRSPLEPESTLVTEENETDEKSTVTSAPASASSSEAEYAKIAALVLDYEKEQSSGSTGTSASSAGVLSATPLAGMREDGLHSAMERAADSVFSLTSTSGPGYTRVVDDKNTEDPTDDWETYTSWYNLSQDVVRKTITKRPVVPKAVWNVWDSEGLYQSVKGTFEIFNNGVKLSIGTTEILWRKRANNTIYARKTITESTSLSVNSAITYTYRTTVVTDDTGNQVIDRICMGVRTDGTTVVVYSYKYEKLSASDGFIWTKVTRNDGLFYFYRVEGNKTYYKHYTLAGVLSHIVYDESDYATGDLIRKIEYFDQQGTLVKTQYYRFSYHYSAHGVQVTRKFSDGKISNIVVQEKRDDGYMIVKDGNNYTIYLLTNGVRIVDKHGKTTTVTLNVDGTWNVTIEGGNTKKVSV